MRAGLLHLPSGISGDMFLGALADAGASLGEMERAVRAVGGDTLSLEAHEVTRAGLRGLHVEVLVDGRPLREPGGPGSSGAGDSDRADGASGPGGHAHGHGAARTFTEIVRLLEGARLEPEIREPAREVFARLAEAEARLHDTTVERVHFHEVGSWDAIADVVGAVAGLRELGLDRLYHGPVHVGGGTVAAAHGVLPAPAPATLELLRDRVCVFEDEVGELATPTGAALVAVLAEPAPDGISLAPTGVGYGAGFRDPAGRPNLARLVWGELSAETAPAARVAVVEASLDDSTPETGGHLIGSLLAAGALDVTLSPLIMKKGRPGFLVRVIAPETRGAEFAERLVRESSSLGARWRVEERLELARRLDRVRLADGEVAVKVAVLPDGAERPHVEYEDAAALARVRGVPLADVIREAEAAWREGREG